MSYSENNSNNSNNTNNTDNNGYNDGDNNDYQHKPSKSTIQLSVILPWILVVLLAGGFGYYFINQQQQIASITEKLNAEQTNTQAWQPPRAEVVENADKSEKSLPQVVSYHDAVAKASQSVVNTQDQENDTNLGSGVVVSTDGYIVTNAHVIEQADEIIVGLNDGRKAKANVVGTDPESDLAVIKVEMTDLKPLAFRAEPIEVGDVALAIGNPFGVGQTVTQGIISATDRTGLGVNTFEDFIQTDAAINPGNSGGALVDAHGQLVGINTMIFSRSGGSMGIGFAIPTVIVEQVMNALIEKGKVSRGWLGIEVQSQIKDPTNLTTSTGVAVMNVIPNSPASSSGLQMGDVILSIDGKDMKDANTLVRYVARKMPNTVLNAKVIRNGEQMEISITLAERPNQKEIQAVVSDNLQREQQDGETGMSEEERERLRQELLDLFENQKN
ncbi:MAG: serine protease [Pseudomonadales bacterium]|nr:MAG: serine protease [Pseudomonadales bacterium]